jgi:adenylylsulfate kinase
VTHGDAAEPEAVLITGVFGSGKSSVAEEMADLLEQRGLPYALMDLDFLVWFDAAGRDAESLMLGKNVAALAANYREAGVRLFVLAGASRDRAEVDSLSRSLGVPLKVVRLIVPLPEIERRLRANAATEARLRDDLPRAAEWLAEGAGEGIEDLAVENAGPVRQVAADVLEWLGWL